MMIDIDKIILIGTPQGNLKKYKIKNKWAERNVRVKARIEEIRSMTSFVQKLHSFRSKLN